MPVFCWYQVLGGMLTLIRMGMLIPLGQEVSSSSFLANHYGVSPVTTNDHVWGNTKTITCPLLVLRVPLLDCSALRTSLVLVFSMVFAGWQFPAPILLSTSARQQLLFF